jgi:hypothetical protein
LPAFGVIGPLLVKFSLNRLEQCAIEDGWLLAREDLALVSDLTDIEAIARSLADFAKLVELFDTHGVSFVSVTQQFNTTTSMGRLTLNVLLSFAQFADPKALGWGCTVAGGGIVSASITGDHVKR